MTDHSLVKSLMESRLSYSYADAVAVHNVLQYLSEGKALASIPKNLFQGSTTAALMVRDTHTDFKKAQASIKASTKKSAVVRQNQARDQFAKYLRWLQEDQITFSQFEKEVKGVLQDLYMDLYYLGAKGSGVYLGQHSGGELTDDDLEMISSMLGQEKRYLYDLLQGIKNGSIDNPMARFDNYVKSSEFVFNNSLVTNLHPASIIYWSRERDACQECVLIDSWSPFTKFTIPCMPKSGQTRCLHNCRCTVTIREGTMQKVAEISKGSYSSKYMLELLRQSRKS